jgi:hypothetical protein
MPKCLPSLDPNKRKFLCFILPVAYSVLLVLRYPDVLSMLHLSIHDVSVAWDNTRNMSANATISFADTIPTKPSVQRSPGRLFYCGWSSDPNYLFPDYDYQPQVWNPSSVNSTPNDILVVGMYGPCLGKVRFFARGGPAQVLQLFEGKVLYINGEAFGHLDRNVIDREYQVGPYSPATDWPQNSLLVYFFVVSFGLLNNQADVPLWDWVFDPNQRRNNTEMHHGVAYFASKCLKFRQRAALRISEVIPVYYGNGCKLPVPSNHTAVQLSNDGGRGNWQQNYEFFHDFKYCLVMENTVSPGYV